MSLILLLNPKQFGGAPVIDQDTSDILDRYKRKRPTIDELMEEELAVQILKSRLPKETTPEAIPAPQFAAALRAKLSDSTLTKDKRKHLQLLLLMITADDYE